jgi:hypothetical protein
MFNRNQNERIRVTGQRRFWISKSKQGFYLDKFWRSNNVKLQVAGKLNFFGVRINDVFWRTFSFKTSFSHFETKIKSVEIVKLWPFSTKIRSIVRDKNETSKWGFVQSSERQRKKEWECKRVRECERDRGVCVCVWKREREREKCVTKNVCVFIRMSLKENKVCVFVFVCVCMCVCVRERESHSKAVRGKLYGQRGTTTIFPTPSRSMGLLHENSPLNSLHPPFVDSLHTPPPHFEPTKERIRFFLLYLL